MVGSFLWNQRGSIEAPRSGLLCLLYPGEGCKMKKKALVVDENGNNLMLAKDLLDDVNSVKLE
jgi:hypothetical protein